MTTTGGVDADRLCSFIERIERLEEEKAALMADIRDVYAELKGAGYCVKTTRQVIKLRKIEADDRREQEEMLDLYKHALGMLADLPLGEAAMEREVSPVRKAVRKMQAARPAETPHNPETGEVLGDAPAPSPDSLGPLRHPEEQPSPSEPRSLTVGSPEYFSPAACANPAAAQVVTGQSGMTATRQPLRTLPPRIPEPAPEMPDLPSFLDRSGEQAEAAQ